MVPIAESGVGVRAGMVPALAALAIAFVATLALTPAVRALVVRLGWLDRPNERSSHRTVTPRGGGLAIVAATVLALGLTASMRLAAGPALWLVAGSLALALVGLWDDRSSLSPAIRMAAQLATAAGMVSIAGGLDRLPLPAPLDLPLAIAGSLLAVVWIVGVVNFYNFLDGIDGLATAQGVVTGIGVALAAWDPFATMMGAALAGACAAFLVFNWSPAKVFLGDVGSAFLGCAFAALPLAAPPDDRGKAVLFMGLSLWLFLADATWTLLRRLARGAPVHQAHREHLYQRLVVSGWTHARVAAYLAAGSVALTGLALAAWRTRAPVLEWGALGTAVLLTAIEIGVTRSREAIVPSRARQAGGLA
jgi:UDP-N-acetylmuramyl pentapeptide phosphotransferase/UDP-N-acetylglucosamine-1-phosphate transferase